MCRCHCFHGKPMWRGKSNLTGCFFLADDAAPCPCREEAHRTSGLCASSALPDCALLSSRNLAACMRCPSLDISSDGSTASTLLGWPLYTCRQSSFRHPWLFVSPCLGKCKMPVR